MDKIKLATEKLAPGMKLGEPIVNVNGVTLMPSGIRLTPMFIARIRKWNIDFIDVYADKHPDDALEAEEAPGNKPAPAGAESSGRPGHGATAVLSRDQQNFIRSVAMDVSRVFVNVMDNPLMAQLRTVTIKRLVMHGPHGAINLMRRGSDSVEESADGS